MMRSLALCRTRVCKNICIGLFVVLASLGMGGVFTYSGMIGEDDYVRYGHSRWLIYKYGLTDTDTGSGRYKQSYTSVPLELVFGTATELLLEDIRDPIWIRKTINYSIFPIGLFLLFVLLQATGLHWSTALLGTASVFGIIRFGGHALWNVKDFHYAMGYLLVTVGQWILLYRIYVSLQKRKLLYGSLSILGIISVLPFLLHSPDISHFGITVCAAIYFALFTKGLNVRQRALLPCIPFVTGLGFYSLLYPPAWEFGPFEAWYTSFKADANYKHAGFHPIRLFGTNMHGKRLPWWFVPAWLPIMIHPLVMISMVVGFGLQIFQKLRIRARELVFPLLRFKIKLSILHWVWMYAIITWSAFLIIRPNLYAEERHQIFIYPLPVLACVLGLDRLRQSWKVILAAILIIVSLVSYIQWGRYAYIYRNPLIIRGENQLTGDYARLCIAEAVNVLPQYAPSGSDVVIGGWSATLANLQIGRAKNSVFFGSEEYPEYTVRRKTPKNKEVYRIGFNLKDGRGYKNRLDGEYPNIQILWESKLPTRETACWLEYVKI